MLGKLANIIIDLIEIYSFMLLIWVIGSWFPQFHGNKIYGFIDNLVAPYARIFRNIIPPLGGFDFSVIIAYIALGFLKQIVASLFSAGL